MSNQTLSAQKVQSTTSASAANMRIALKLVANESFSFAAQAEMNSSAFAAIKSCSLADSIGLSAIVLEIDVSSLDDTSAPANQAISFSDYLAQAIVHIEQQQSVLLSHPAMPYRLLMMPAIVAAKHRCHPHAYLTGMGDDSNAKTATSKALSQAKRAHISPIQVDATHCNSYKDKFAELITLVGNIAARSMPETPANLTADSSTYWFSEMHQSRVACFNITEGAHHHAAVLVQGTELAQAKSMLDEKRIFIPLSADNLQAFKLQLTDLHAQLDSIKSQSDNIMTLMLTQLEKFANNNALSAVIMANSAAAAFTEAEAMLLAVETALNNNTTELDYKTPSGSCLHTSSLQKDAHSGVCFVYPGVGTVYPQMFAQLPSYFPTLFSQLEREGDVKAMLQAESIYAENAKVSDMSLDKLAIAGVGVSYILTKILTQHFAIKPNFAMGYSMGEASMWASLDVWKTPHNMIEATQTNSIFTTDISGRLDCVRQAWQLNHDEDIVWNSFVVRAEPSIIEAALSDYPRAYLAIVQGDTCVLAGCEQSCKALLKQIGKRGIAANRVTAMHTQPAMLIRDNVQTFYQQPLHDQAVLDAQAAQIQFMSAASTIPVSVTSEAIADSIADTFCHPLNFTELVNNTRKQGASLFVEIGADRQTSTLIDKIARTTEAPNTVMNSACQAIATNAKGGDDLTALLKCIAQLVAHNVPLSLNYLTDGLTNLLTTQLMSAQKSQTAMSQSNSQLASQLEGEQS